MALKPLPGPADAAVTALGRPILVAREVREVGNLKVRARILLVGALPGALLAAFVLIGPVHPWSVVALGAGGAASLAVALVSARAIAAPMRQLARSTQHAADHLPEVVGALRDPRRTVPAGGPEVPRRGPAELRDLAGAIAALRAAAIDVAAAEAEEARAGVSSVYLRLARRHHDLLSRQIQLLDEMEASEQDPDAIGQLFRLDHLATRMRRNAESLLVLTGWATPARRRVAPAVMLDVVRAAIAEVEGYERVRVAGFSHAGVVPAAVVDLVHLVAELVENALRHSPRDAPVVVEGGAHGDGYHVRVVDAGAGMSDERCEQLNGLLQDPPEIGTMPEPTVGLLVAGRLASRHGVGVRLARGALLGTVASVSVPASVLVSLPEPAPPDALQGAPRGGEHEDAGASGWPASLAAALPGAASLDDELATILNDAVTRLTAEPPAGPGESPAEGDGRAAGEVR